NLSEFNDDNGRLELLGDNGVFILHETARKAKLSSRIYNELIILHTMSGLVYVFGILLADVTDRMAELLPLMMKMEYPFVISTIR
ncbi:Odorant receptor 422, partial [Nylanderia fulva]